MKALQQTGVGLQAGIINKYNNPGTNSTANGFLVRLTSTNLFFVFTDAPNNNYHFTDATPYLNNQWFDVSLNCYFGDMVRIYINSNLVDSFSMANISGTLSNNVPLFFNFT